MNKMTEKEIIYKALKEYENNHYMDEGKKWQIMINKLIDKFSK